MFVRWIHLNHRKVDLSIGVRLPVLEVYVCLLRLAHFFMILKKTNSIHLNRREMWAKDQVYISFLYVFTGNLFIFTNILLNFQEKIW